MVFAQVLTPSDTVSGGCLISRSFTRAGGPISQPTFEFRTKTLPVRRDGSPTTIEISLSTPLHAPSAHSLRRGGDTNVEVYLEDQGGWTQTGGTLRAMEGAFNDDTPGHSVTESGEVDATLAQLPHPGPNLPDLHISGHWGCVVPADQNFVSNDIPHP